MLKWLTLSLLLVSTYCLAQDTLTYLADYKGNKANENQAVRKRVTWQESEGWRVNDYFLNGSLESSATYLSDSFKLKTGQFELFFENGQMSIQAVYRENQLVGKFKSWFSNGNLSSEGTYADDFLRDPAVIKERQNQNEEDRIKIFSYDSLSIKLGTWKYYHKNGELSAVEEYDEEGMLTSVDYFEPDGTPSGKDAVVKRLPEFPGGVDALMRFLRKNIKYPKKERRQGKSGLVIISFDINEEGIMENTYVIQSVSPLLDAEALRVAKSMPIWAPGRMQNRNVTVSYNLPIKFTL